MQNKIVCFIAFILTAMLAAWGSPKQDVEAGRVAFEKLSDSNLVQMFPLLLAESSSLLRLRRASSLARCTRCSVITSPAYGPSNAVETYSSFLPDDAKDLLHAHPRSSYSRVFSATF